jgi:hypothetical protein
MNTHNKSRKDKKIKYIDETEGRWIFPKRKGYLMRCCDCGLVHRLDFRLNGKHIEFRIFREEGRTGQVRRWMKQIN